MPGRLEGKVAIVTGGGGGFGKGIAQKFLQEGAKVIIADFVEDIGQKTADELKCDFHRTDVTSKADWEALRDFCHKKYGKIDCVINNAGCKALSPLSRGHRNDGSVALFRYTCLYFLNFPA